MSQETTVEQPASPNTSASSPSNSLQTTTAVLTDTPTKPEIKGLEGALSSSPLSPIDKETLLETSQKSPNGKTVDKQYFEQQLLLAQTGDAAAQCNLGVCYGQGRGVTKDEVKAVEWYTKAATQGLANAQHNLGVCYEDGYGVTRDEAKAVEWYTKAAAQGHVEAQYKLGVRYMYGHGVVKNEAKAVEWYKKAAVQGHAAARANLGWHYEHGYGVVKNEAKAVEWYTKAAVQGRAAAQTNLGVCYEHGRGVTKDEVKAVEWYTKAAAQGNMNAQTYLGLCYWFGRGVTKNEAKAVEWYTKAAVQGFANAQHSLGWCYGQGRGVVKDEAKAMEWYTKAAAQNRLGQCYEWGWGVVKDEVKAVEWYTKAAAQGDVAAQTNLGLWYEQGRGVAKDEAKAVEWYTQAATQGDADAQTNLGVCYEKGRGIVKDEIKAAEWYGKAAANQVHMWAHSRLVYYHTKEKDDAIDLDTLEVFGNNSSFSSTTTEKTQDGAVRLVDLPPDRRTLAAVLFVAIDSKEWSYDLGIEDWNFDIDAVKKLITQGVPLNVKNNHGKTPLHYAVSQPSPFCFQTINVLLATSEGRASINQTDDQGKTPLHYAVSERGAFEWGTLKTVNTLFHHGASVNQADEWGRTPLVFAALYKQFDAGVALLEYDAGFQQAENWLLGKQREKNLSEKDIEFYTQGLSNLKFINKSYQAKLAASKHNKAETKQEIGDGALATDHLSTSKNTSYEHEQSEEDLLGLDVLPASPKAETKQEVNSDSDLDTEQEQNKDNLLFDLDEFFPATPTDRETKESKQTKIPAVEVSQLTTDIQQGDTAALSKVLATPVAQQSAPLQHYLQSQAIWTVLDPDAKPAHKSAQIALLAEAPNISLLVENEQHQLPLDVALQQLAKGQIDKAAVQKLQEATCEQRAAADEEILQAIEIYAQTAPTDILEEKASARPGEAKSMLNSEDGSITPQQLAAEAQKLRAADEALQQQFKAVSLPTLQSSASSSSQPKQLSKQQRNLQKKLFQQMVHQLVSKKFIQSVGIGQGWVEAVSTKKATVAKAGVTFAVGTALNVVAPGAGGLIASGGKALAEKGYSERQKALSRKHTLGLISLKQLAMVTSYIEHYLLHRYQDFLLQQNLLLSRKAMETFIHCLIERMCLYVEKIDKPEDIIPLLSDKLVNLSKQKKTNHAITPNVPFTDAAAAQVAENLVAGTSLLNLGLVDSLVDKVGSGTDALITCLTADGGEKELRVHDICHSPAVTLTAQAEKASLQINTTPDDLEYEGRYAPGSQWTVGECGVRCISREEVDIENCGVRCISREEADIENLSMIAKWRGDLPISRVQSDIAKLQAKVQELEQQVAAEQAKRAMAETGTAIEKARADAAEAKAHGEKTRADTAEKRANTEKTRADAAEERANTEKTRANAAEARVSELVQQLDDAELSQRSLGEQLLAMGDMMEKMEAGKPKPSAHHQSNGGPGMFAGSSSLGKPTKPPAGIASPVAGQPQLTNKPKSNQPSSSVTSTRSVSNTPGGGF